MKWSVCGDSVISTMPSPSQHAKNWVSSTDPLDEAQRTSKQDVCRVSAGLWRLFGSSWCVDTLISCFTGTPRHEQTSWFAFESIFTYFKEEHSSEDKKEEAADRVEGATGSGDAGIIEDKKENTDYALVGGAP